MEPMVGCSAIFTKPHRQPSNGNNENFVAGATGALGRRLIPILIKAGHAVKGMTRSPLKMDALRTSGAVPVLAGMRWTQILSRRPSRHDLTL
jgi:nucleoside-diphosphate-sugar epimerase